MVIDKSANINGLYENLNFLKNQSEEQEKLIVFLKQNMFQKDQEIKQIMFQKDQEIKQIMFQKDQEIKNFNTRLYKNNEEYDMLVERFNSLECEKEEICNRNNEISTNNNDEISRNREEIFNNQNEIIKLSEQIQKMNQDGQTNPDSTKDTNMNQITIDREEYFNIREKKNELERSVKNDLDTINI